MRPCIMVVEDDEPTAHELSEIIIADGYNCVTYLSPIEALSRASNDQSIDIVITDFRMPGCDGLSFVKTLREKRSDIRVIFISGNADKNHVADAMLLDASAFLEKPICPTRLMDLVRIEGDRIKSDSARRQVYEEMVENTRRLSSELSDARTELERQKFDVKAADIAKRDFLRLINHELRTPLNAVIGGLSILDDKWDYSSPQTSKIVETSYSNAVVLVNMVDQILQLTERQDASQYTYEKISPIDVINLAVLGCTEMARRSRVTIDVNNTVLENTYIEADRVRFSLALKLIIENAVKFSDEGGRVDVTVEYIDEKVQFVISDQGPGMKKTQIDELSDPSCYIITKGDEFRPGLGIGLSLSQRIIFEHTGQLIIYMNEPTGTVCLVSLPAK